MLCIIFWENYTYRQIVHTHALSLTLSCSVCRCVCMSTNKTTHKKNHTRVFLLVFCETSFNHRIHTLTKCELFVHSHLCCVLLLLLLLAVLLALLRIAHTNKFKAFRFLIRLVYAVWYGRTCVSK